MKLHLGCGPKKIEGFVNIDIYETDATDLICDIKDLHTKFEKNSVDYIYACHVLEHFSRHEYKDVLSTLLDLLAPGGMLRISVPDFEGLIRHYNETGDLSEIRGTMFGGQRNPYDYHCWGWDFNQLQKDLSEMGFVNIKRYDPFTTSHANVRDWSRDYVPRHDEDGNELPDEIWHKGTLVSLNVEAVKPPRNI